MVWGVSARIILRVMKSEVRDFSDMKPQSDDSKEMLRNYLNTVIHWGKMHFICSHDLKKIIMIR